MTTIRKTQDLYCVASVPDGGRSVTFHQCSFTGSLVHLGKRYCKKHYPPNIEAKSKASQKKFDDEWGEMQRQGKITDQEERVLVIAAEFHNSVAVDGVLPSEWVASGKAQNLYSAVAALKKLGWTP